MGDDLDELVDRVNTKLREIMEWCSANRLSLNVAKCEFMLITNRVVEGVPSIQIGPNQLKIVDTFRYLGVEVDKNLKFHTHINKLKGKLSQLCGVSFRLRSYLNHTAARSLYYSCVYSTIIYCIAVWGGMLNCTSSGSAVQKIQKKVVLNLFSRFHTDGRCIFKAEKILKVLDVYRLRVAMYMYKMINMGMYPGLMRSLELNHVPHDYNTRSSSDPRLPFPRVEAVRMSFGYQFVRVWNEIPQAIRSSPSSKIFKKSVISWYLDQY